MKLSTRCVLAATVALVLGASAQAAERRTAAAPPISVNEPGLNRAEAPPNSASEPVANPEEPAMSESTTRGYIVGKGGVARKVPPPVPPPKNDEPEPSDPPDRSERR